MIQEKKSIIQSETIPVKESRGMGLFSAPKKVIDISTNL